MVGDRLMGIPDERFRQLCLPEHIQQDRQHANARRINHNKQGQKPCRTFFPLGSRSAEPGPLTLRQNALAEAESGSESIAQSKGGTPFLK